MAGVGESESFLARWRGQGGGAERSNFHLFITEMCRCCGLPPPTPAVRDADNDYVFERQVRLRPSEGEGVHGWIDLYKRGCFILEAKQSRMPGGGKRPPGLEGENEDAAAREHRGRRLHGRGWDKLMRNARSQAEAYVDHLPPDHPAPPFLIVCDIGHVFEIYADFSGTGRNYTFFPDREGYRIFLDDLRRAEVRDLLRTIWTEPHSLDPARHKGRATREIARDLARVSRSLEGTGAQAEQVALFLMRCIFCMFACSVGLLPQGGLVQLLDRCLENPKSFPPLMRELWVKMNDPLYEARYYPGLDAYAPYMGGKLFHHPIVFALEPEAIAALRAAAERSWAEVEPAIFGALLEGALEPQERRRLGAHYTPRAHVERLVRATVMEPLRREWRQTLTKIERARDAGAPDRAQRWARGFHARLRQVRVLDPACGTGNFLYIALELMKALEAEVLETLAQLGAPELLQLEVIDPRQFLGLELNPRAAVIAELVLWIGFLQLHYRTQTGHPAEPILRAYDTIRHADAVLQWDGWPLPRVEAGPHGQEERLANPRQPAWPEAEFIVGNPPFLGGKDLRARLGDAYAEALWAAHPRMNRSADLVMYWWDHAADLLTREGSALRRFGFVTTNSLSQTFQRQTLERRLTAAHPIHLVYALPDHPWTRATPDAAAVRVAMTVAEAGCGGGVRLEVVREAGLDSDTPELEFHRTYGRLNSDLTIGADLGAAAPLQANRGLCSPGVKLHGSGFIVSLEQARALGLGRRPGLEDYIRPYRNGRDIVQQARDVWVIDLYPLPADAVRTRFPEVYQHLLAKVKPHRDTNRMAFRREHWWWFGATHEMYRSFTAGLDRYICTPETAKHRIFVFLPVGTRADNMLVNFGLSDSFHLGVLSSRPHLAWAQATGASLEDRPRYTKSACFDPFPFPDATPALRAEIAAVATEIDTTRAAVQAEHPDLTLTSLYNAMGGGGGSDVQQRGRTAILRELHDRLDRLVLQAYGLDRTVARADLLTALAALNQARRVEEADGRVRWLRPDYQLVRYGGERSNGVELRLVASTNPRVAQRPLFPRDRDEQSAAVLQGLSHAGGPLDVAGVVACFRNRPPRMAQQVEAALMILAQYGHATLTPDGRFLVRRAA